LGGDDKMATHKEVTKMLIGMWDKREYTLDLAVQENVEDLMMAVINECNDDKEKALKVFEEVLEKYNEGSYCWNTLNSEVDEYRNGEGQWEEVEEDDD
tara:strand:+ start:645 stop:938 length:294 start_codon:yes stop_codon:yes gene_type:complete